MIRSTMPVTVLLAAAIALTPAGFGPAHGATNGTYVPGIGDLPLMSGLRPVAGQDLVFDKPDGRIVQAVARGPVATSEVRAFYAAALPQLGWREAGPDRWLREGEQLALEFPGPDRRAAAPVTVRFLLSPR